MNSDHFVYFLFFTREHWLCSLIRLRFYYLTCLNFNVELFFFVIFFTFFFVFIQLFFIYRLSLQLLRNYYLTLFLFIDDHDAMIVKWSSTKKKKLLKKETSTKLCCVVCVSLNRKREWESWKFWELWSNFDLRKENLTLFLTIRSSIYLS
jgi:hypothetical protein